MRSVPAVGPINAKMMLVGEAPGQTESRIGIPFIGSAGKILNGMLINAGIDRAECRITNVVNVRPPGNDFGVFYKDSNRSVPTQELLNHRQRLYDEIDVVNPNVIVALGGEALKALTGHRYITKWRGSIIPTRYGKVVAALHPAMIMRRWDLRPVTVFDLIRAKGESTSPDFKEEKKTLITSPSLERVTAEFNMLMRSEYISFDIETIRGTSDIRCIAFAGAKDRAICVPFEGRYRSSYWVDAAEMEVWSLVAKLLGNDSKKIAQNAQFDVTMLGINNVRVNNLWADTMLMHHTLHPELPKGLDFLCSVYTRQPYYKDMVSRDLWRYNCLDAVVTYEVAMVLLEELKDFGTKRFYFQRVHPMIEPLMNIQNAGVASNDHLRRLLRSRYEKDIEAKQSILSEAVGRPLNVNSPKQMMGFLYDELGLPEKKNRSTGRKTVNEDALVSLAKKYPTKLFQLILDIRGDQKLLSTFVNMPLGPDGRVRTTYSIGGTLTGRLASHKYIDGTGGNLQNNPKGPLRMMLIPDGDKVFVGADLSQAEARLVAYLAEELSQIKAFESGEDIHVWNAASIFRKPKDEVTKGERSLAKRLVHASNYGIGPRGFAAAVGCSQSDAADALNRYFAAFPAIKLWHLKIQETLNRRRVLKTPLGRKRTFFNIIDLKGYAYIPQSTVADVVNESMVSLYWSLPEGARVVLNVHDCLVCECRKSQIAQVRMLMKNAMERPLTIHGRVFTIPVEILVGNNWDEVS